MCAHPTIHRVLRRGWDGRARLLRMVILPVSNRASAMACCSIAWAAIFRALCAVAIAESDLRRSPNHLNRLIHLGGVEVSVSIMNTDEPSRREPARMVRVQSPGPLSTRYPRHSQLDDSGRSRRIACVSMYPISNAQAEKQVLDSFVAWIRDHEVHPEDGAVEVDHHPDKPEDGRGAGGCDAVLSRFGKKNAVEITQVEPLNNMQASAARLMPLKALILAFVRAEFPGHFVTVSVREDQLPRLFDPRVLADQIIQKLRITPPGSSSSCEVAGAAVEIHHYMHSGAGTLLMMGLATGRDMDGDLQDSIRVAILNNLKEKLLVAKREGAITSLILDAREVGLDEMRVAKAFAAVWPSVATDDIDEIWIARSLDGPVRFVPLKQGVWVYNGDEVTFKRFRASLMHAWIWKPKTAAGGG